ncbi:MAG: insulinase family protein [Candidatus Zixiibacteriota bacterium]|nr:MAG: insulinase family protein [candidate division Zixibacteria bacterium]
MRLGITVTICALSICTIPVVDAFGGGILPEHSSFTLANGLQVILVEDHRWPILEYSMLFKTGSAVDSARICGLAGVTMEMLKEGAEKFPGGALIEAIDSVGGLITFDTRQYALFIKGSFLARDEELALQLVAQMVTAPKFDEEGLDRLKKRYDSVIMQVNSVARYRLIHKLYGSIYGDDGYGLPSSGTRAGIRRIELDDVRSFYERNVRPNNAALVIAGDFKAGDVKKLIKKLFSKWEKGTDFSRPIANQSIPDSLRIIILDNPEAASSEFMIGRPAVPSLSEAVPAFILLDYLLGGAGEISRLSRCLIRQHALATTISSSIDWSTGDGMLSIYGGATNEMTAEAIRQVLATLQDLRNIRVPAGELGDAKSHFRGEMAGYFQNPSRTVNMLSRIISLNLKLNFHDQLLKQFDSVDPGVIRKTAQKFLDENHLTVVVMGPEDILRRGLSELGQVEVISTGRN